MLYGAGVLLSVARLVPFVHLPAYAETHGTGAVAGRPGRRDRRGEHRRTARVGALTARAGVLRTYQACFAALAGSFALLGDPSYARLVLFAVLLGVGYGGFRGSRWGRRAVAERVRGAGARRALGVLYTSAALGSAVGPPLAGVLIGRRGTARPSSCAGRRRLSAASSSRCTGIRRSSGCPVEGLLNRT